MSKEKSTTTADTTDATRYKPEFVSFDELPEIAVYGRSLNDKKIEPNALLTIVP